MEDKSQAKITHKEIFVISLLDCRRRTNIDGAELCEEPRTLVTTKRSRADKIYRIAKAYDIHCTIHELWVWSNWEIQIRSTIGRYPPFGFPDTFGEVEQDFKLIFKGWLT